MAHVSLIALTVIFSIPFFWLVTSSLKIDQQLVAFPIVWVPNPITFDHYIYGLQFMAAWGDYLGPLIYLSDKDLYTVSLGLALFRGEYNAEFGGLMAASTVMMLPVVILFFLTQRTFIQGITLTGIKG